MRRKNENPDHSSFQQILIDSEKQMKISDNPNASEILKAIKFIKDNMTPHDIDAIDKIFKSHNYPDHVITFIKLFLECEIWEHLSMSACRVLLRMCRKMSIDCCYLLNRDILCNVLHISKRTIIRAVEELEELGCITKVCTFKTTTKDHITGTVYMINGHIATVGKSKNLEIYEKIIPDELLDVFEDNCYNTTDIIKSKIDTAEFNIISFNYEVIITDEL